MECVDFFSECLFSEPARTDSLFGINDGVQEGQGNEMAYTTTEGNKEDWNALVENTRKVEVVFTPLDHNIVLHPQKGTTYSLCDGMLHSSDGCSFVIFVELKVKGSSWIEECISQLKSTLSLFFQTKNIDEIKKCQAYAVNKKHPSFHYSHKEVMQRFRNETKVRLKIQREIII